MKNIKYLAILMIAIMLAGCTAQKANNTATANSPQTAQTGTDVQNTQTAFPTSVNTTEALQSNSAQTPEELQNGPENDHLRIDNYIYAVSQKEALDERKTYRIDIGTGKIEQFNDVGMDNMIYYDGWIYYTYYAVYMGNPLHEEWDQVRFNRIRPDGSEKGSACEIPYTLKSAFIQDGYLYGIVNVYYYWSYNGDTEYSNDYYRPVRFKLHEDGSLGERELIFSDSGVGAGKITYYDGWLYYNRTASRADGETGFDEFGIYRCRPDGTDNTKLHDDYIGERTESSDNVYLNTDFCISNGWMFFTAKDLSNSEYNIYKMRPDGTEAVLVYDEESVYATYINYMNGWVYFQSHDENNVSTICRVRDDGTGYGALFEGFDASYMEWGRTWEEITLTEKYIIFIETVFCKEHKEGMEPMDTNIYRMGLDGSNNVKWE